MRVLLVDHDSEALETITRAIRGVLELDCVTSKGDALLLLRQNTYDVLIACERCVDGSGLDLLGRTTRTAVPLKRIFAAPPERLQLLGPRLAPFKVQRTINYPIDLEELWLAIAQVTGDGDEETDGTIERVVLDERGIPATGSVPRSPIPPRPPAPLTATAPPMAVATAARAAMRVPAPAQEASPRAPAPRTVPTTSAAAVARPPAPPRTTSDTGRMRAVQMTATPPAPAMSPMPASGPADFPAWQPERPVEDDFAQVAAQARFGVQQEARRRSRTRVATAAGIAVVVGGAILTLLYRYYDPEKREREAAIAAEVARMAEQQKVTDRLTLLENDIENAIMDNDLDTARRELAVLVEEAPQHPRREFLQASIDRAAELARLSAQDGGAPESAPAQAAMLPSAGDRDSPRTRTAQRTAERSTRPEPRPADRSTTTRNRETAASTPRVYGAPIGEVPRQTLPLNAPINAAPITTISRADNSFAGRTLEAADQSLPRAPSPPPPPAQSTASVPAPSASAAGSALAPMPNAAPAASQAGSAAVDVVPAKIVKRVTPVAPAGTPRKASGYVVVRFNIGTNGRVSDLEVVESQPRGMFDEAAQDAVRKWLYEPRKENGVAVASTAKARLVFDAAN